MLRLDPEEKLKVDEQDSKVFISTLTSLKLIIEIPTKSYVDSLHEINRNRHDVSSVFNDQDNEINNNKLTNLDSISVNRDPSCDTELANKNYVDDSIGSGNGLRFVQTIQNSLKVSVGNDTYNLTKFQVTVTTNTKYPNTDGYLLQTGAIKCNDKNNKVKSQNFIKSTKNNSPTGDSGATGFPPFDNVFMYIETSSNNQSKNVFVSIERTSIIQISNITFFHKRFSILPKYLFKSLGRCRIQLLLEEITWNTRYNIPKKDRYSVTSIQWTKLSLQFTEGNYSVKLVFDEIVTAHADTCFSNFVITQSV